MSEVLFTYSGAGDHPALTCVASELRRFERVFAGLDWDADEWDEVTAKLFKLRQLQREGVEYVANH